MSEDEFLGKPLRRREDHDLLLGAANYTDDIHRPDAAHAAILRSQYPHADLGAIDTSAAKALNNVVAVYTADDLDRTNTPGRFRITGALPEITGTEYGILAGDTVRYTGEPIALVVAEDRYAVQDALDVIDVEYNRKPAVIDVETALEPDAPVLHDDIGSNRAMEWAFGNQSATDAAFDRADHVSELEVENQRLIPNPLEPRTVLAEANASTQQVTVTASTQAPHGTRGDIAEALGLSESQVRVVSPDVGGGFGVKGSAPYAARPLVAWAAMQIGRPVKWQATRSETHLTDRHARGFTTKGEIAVSAAGAIQGLRYKVYMDVGAYLMWSKTPAPNFKELSSGAYDIPCIYGEVFGAFTNTTPIGPYRGAGRPEGIYAVERLVGHAARKLDVDPIDFRRQNLIPPGEFPFETAVGTAYDSGNYEAAMDKAVAVAGYDELRRELQHRRECGRLVGVGVSVFVENTGTGPGRGETARITVDTTGEVTVFCGTHDHGQGHRTTFSQLVADHLGIPITDVTVKEGDTADLPSGTGTFGSRSAPVGGTVIAQTADAIIEQARTVAADHFEAPEADIEFTDGQFRVQGAPDRAITVQELARSSTASSLIESGTERVWQAQSTYDPETNVYSFGTHIATVEVDQQTGEVTLLQYAAVDDCGRIINPMIVEGQVHGGIAQGIGQALYEHAEYDDNGSLLTGSLMDYAMPRAFHIPDMVTDRTTTPTPKNPIGVKGTGESGTIAAPPAVVNAVIDAVTPLGVENIDMPLTSETVWQAMQQTE